MVKRYSISIGYSMLNQDYKKNSIALYIIEPRKSRLDRNSVKFFLIKKAQVVHSQHKGCFA